MRIGNTSAAVASQLPAMLPARGISKPANAVLETSPKAASTAGRDVKELRETFAQFVGETFFGQMMKSMRAMTGKPAYFHGGRAEEAFQGQLDQKLAEQLTEASAHRFAEPMFERQFPHLSGSSTRVDLEQLESLRQS
jgi:Rod binding domain-containing protein